MEGGECSWVDSFDKCSRIARVKETLSKHLHWYSGHSLPGSLDSSSFKQDQMSFSQKNIIRAFGHDESTGVIMASFVST